MMCLRIHRMASCMPRWTIATQASSTCTSTHSRKSRLRVSWRPTLLFAAMASSTGELRSAKWTGGNAPTFDFSDKSPDQIAWLSGHGINGWKEAAQAEIARRNQSEQNLDMVQPAPADRATAESRYKEILRQYGSKTVGKMWKPSTPLEIKTEAEQLRNVLTQPQGAPHAPQEQAPAGEKGKKKTEHERLTEAAQAFGFVVKPARVLGGKKGIELIDPKQPADGRVVVGTKNGKMAVILSNGKPGKPHLQRDSVDAFLAGYVSDNVSPDISAQGVATHQDAGKPEEAATPAVVAESLQKGDANTRLDIRQMRERLLGDIDAAARTAQSAKPDMEGVRISSKPATYAGVKTWQVDGPENADGLTPSIKIEQGKTGGFRIVFGGDRVSAPNLEIAKEDAARIVRTGAWSAGNGPAGQWTFDKGVLDEKNEYVTFDVPGDGKFKVLNTAEALADFRRKVEASPGFREQRAPSTQAPRKNASPAEVRRMAKEPLADKSATVEDLANAIEIARANGIDDIPGLLDRFKEVANMDYDTWRGEQEVASAEGQENGVRSGQGPVAQGAQEAPDQARDRKADQATDVQPGVSEVSQAGAPAGVALSTDVPNAVKDHVRWALDRLRDEESSLDGVERARGKGHTLALELRDKMPAIQKARDALAEFRRLAKNNNVDAEAVINSLGGEPDFSRFGEPAQPEQQKPAPTKASVPAAEAPEQVAMLEYINPSEVDTPAQGRLNQAREGKTRAYSEVKRLRQAIKDEPVGGNRQGLRLELIKAEDRHNEFQRMERDSLEQIEERANELGKTTKRTPKNESDTPKFKRAPSAEPITPDAFKKSVATLRQAFPG